MDGQLVLMACPQKCYDHLIFKCDYFFNDRRAQKNIKSRLLQRPELIISAFVAKRRIPICVSHSVMGVSFPQHDYL